MSLITALYTNPWLSPAYNPNVISYKDTNIITYNLVNYRYYFYVYVRTDSTSAYTLAGEYTLFPETTSIAWFDVSRILQNYISSDFRYNISGFDTVNPKGCLEYKVEVWRKYVQYGIEYFQLLTTYPNGFKLFDGALSLNELNQWGNTYNDVIYPGSTTRPLSNLPNNLKLNTKDFYTVQLSAFLPDAPTTYVKTMVVVPVSAVGPKIFIKQRTANNNIAKQMMAVGIGPANLLALGTGPNISETSGWSAHLGGYPVIDETTTRYDVYFYMQDDTTLAIPKITIELERNEHYHGNDRYWLVYKNKYGAYSWLKFEAKMYKSLNVKKELYQKQIDKKTMLSTSGKYLRGLNVIGSDTTEKYTLNSDYANVIEQGFFEELIASSCVYLLKPIKKNSTAETVNNIIPVQITDSNYTLLTQDNVNLVQYTIEVDASLPKNIQRS